MRLFFVNLGTTAAEAGGTQVDIRSYAIRSVSEWFLARQLASIRLMR